MSYNINLTPKTSGLEFYDADPGDGKDMKISLRRDCATNETLKWANGVWNCAPDNDSTPDTLKVKRVTVDQPTDNSDYNWAVGCLADGKTRTSEYISTPSGFIGASVLDAEDTPHPTIYSYYAVQGESRIQIRTSNISGSGCPGINNHIIVLLFYL